MGKGCAACFRSEVLGGCFAQKTHVLCHGYSLHHGCELEVMDHITVHNRQPAVAYFFLIRLTGYLKGAVMLPTKF